jgi:hypothetical protein
LERLRGLMAESISVTGLAEPPGMGFRQKRWSAGFSAHCSTAFDDNVTVRDHALESVVLSANWESASEWHF